MRVPQHSFYDEPCLIHKACLMVVSNHTDFMTKEEVVIYDLQRGCTYREIQEERHISTAAISKIAKAHGLNGKSNSKFRHRLTENQEQEIQALIENGTTATEISKLYEISYGAAARRFKNQERG